MLWKTSKRATITVSLEVEAPEHVLEAWVLFLNNLDTKNTETLQQCNTKKCWFIRKMFRIPTMGNLLILGQRERWRQRQSAYGSQIKPFNLPLKIRKLCPLESGPLFQANWRSLRGPLTGYLRRSTASWTWWPLMSTVRNLNFPSGFLGDDLHIALISFQARNSQSFSS